MTDMTAHFVFATKKKLRYDSTRGALTVEQLWDLPLTAANGFSLDAVARTVNAELKAMSEESFVETSTNPRKGELESALEIVKFVIATKQAENAKVRERAERADERRKILDAIEKKNNEELSGATKEELLKRLALLDA